MRFTKLLILYCLGTACTSSEPPEDTASKIKQVETNLTTTVHFAGDSTWTIESRMAHYGVPGVSIAVIVDNKIAWTKTYGVMNKERKDPVTEQTLFQAGSISKPVAAYGALKIAEMGRINPDENVNTYLKSWQLPDNEFTKEKKVTLKHLLSHTGGVTVHGFLGYSPDLPVPSLLQILNGEPPANSDAIRVDKLPGDGFRYSGGGYTIMQQMLIDVEGKPFPQILQEQVLGPLGMVHSTYDQPLSSEQLPLAATGYVPDGSMTKGERHTYPEMAAAGLWTTAEDLARFAIDIQLSFKGESNKVLSRSMVQQMLTPFMSEDRGLGPYLDISKDDFYFGHGGWDEGFSCEMLAHRDRGYGVVVLTNANQPPFIEELMNAVALTYNWSDFLQIYQPISLNKDLVSKVVGRYRYDLDGVATIYEKDAKLFLEYLSGETMELRQVTDSTFARRERTALVQIKTNPGDGKPYLIFWTDSKPSPFNRPRMAEGEKVPYEWIMVDDAARAEKEYILAVKSNPANSSVSQQSINERGYDLMNKGDLTRAKALFGINMRLYPDAADVYDSYAEACMKNGDTAEAIKYYKKTLSMNSNNQNAVKNLAVLEKK